ncbi:helix-turn-helix transcriptional regulator [Pantoea sp.]|uniref:helix-turn-helix transcriptional regulator n=1 Tax=Pantoea sp. TaxID=69393 RepID=UPI0028A8887A|nr:helix-turn-helix transcriptional regulator [Pantoea sp.]
MNNIRTFRKHLGLTQSDLAKFMGCTAGAICHYETGRRGMDIELCRKFIGAFKTYGIETTIDDLFPPRPLSPVSTLTNGHEVQRR